METNSQLLPQARATDLVTRELPDEVLVYDLKQHQAHCLNQTAAAIWSYCDGQTSIPMMAHWVSRDMKVVVSEEAVWLALDQLSKAELLKQEIAKPNALKGISRRQVLRRLGLSAVIVPLVTSIIAPTAQASSTCIDMPCSTPADCGCTNCCSFVFGPNRRLCRTGGTFPPNTICVDPCECASGTCTTPALDFPTHAFVRILC